MRSLPPLLCLIVVCGTGCTTAQPDVSEDEHVYEFSAQVLAMPSCKATVVRQAPCYSRFTTEGGRVFYIGSPGAEREVARFLGALEDGKSYYLPHAFMEYLKANEKKSNKSTAGATR